MGTSAKVINRTSGFRIRLGQAKRRVEQCVSAWVRDKEGFEIYDLTLSEMVAARSQFAAKEALKDLPFAEIPGIIFQHGDGAQIRMEKQLAAQANRFAAQTAIQ